MKMNSLKIYMNSFNYKNKYHFIFAYVKILFYICSINN